jgi:hypothetical protein
MPRMRRILGTLTIAFVLPFLVLAAMAWLGATPGSWELLIAFGVGMAAAAVYWRRSSPSPST